MADEFESIVNDAVATHPDPSPMADDLIDEAIAEDAPIIGGDDPSAGPGPGDRIPPGWDKTIHAWPPRLTARKTWAMKRKASGPVPMNAAILAAADPAQLASNYAEMFFSVCTILLGPDWQPNDSERSEVRRQLARFLVARGITTDLPPGLALVAAMGAYALPRAMLPSTRERFGAIVGNARSMFVVTDQEPAPAAPSRESDGPAADDAGGVTAQAPIFGNLRAA